MDKRVFLRSAAVGWVGDQEGMKGIQYPSPLTFSGAWRGMGQRLKWQADKGHDRSIG